MAVVEQGKPSKKYRGLSHSEIIEKQGEELHSVITTHHPPTPPTAINSESSPSPTFTRRPSKIKGWQIDGDTPIPVEAVTDERGRIRLSLVRDCFRFARVESEAGRKNLVDCYERWVKCNEYLWLERVSRLTGETKQFCVKCAKRGNDVYRWRLDHRLGWIEGLEEKEFFNAKDRNVRGKTTRMLFVVLTFDTKRCSRREAWETINENWNRWITAVRKKYGGVKHFKSFESFKNGYPHVNAVLLFEDAEFEVSYQDKNKRYRILRKDKDWLDDQWHSNVDVQACYSTGAFSYVKKYMLKTYGKRNDVRGINEEQAKLTVALLWVFRKQSFSVSGGLHETINDLILKMHNSNCFIIPLAGWTKNLYEYHLLDIITFEELVVRGKAPPSAKGKWWFELPFRSVSDRAQRKLSSYR